MTRSGLASVTIFIGLLLLAGAAWRAGIIKIVPRRLPTPVPAVVEEPAATGPGVPSRIAAQAIGLDAPVSEMSWRQLAQWGEIVSEWDIPSIGAAWHRNSARPGQGGNIVISGHNNSAGNRVFAMLQELEVGDEITLWDSQGTSYLYRVDEKELVRIFAASQETKEYLQTVVAPTSQEQLTLITCWPSWSNTHRLVILAKPLQKS